MKPNEILNSASDKEQEELVEILNVLRDAKKSTEVKNGQQQILPDDTNSKALQNTGTVTIRVHEGKYLDAGAMIQTQMSIIPHRLTAKSPGGNKIIQKPN